MARVETGSNAFIYAMPVTLVGADVLFIGEIVESYADERILTNGKPDVTKMKPFALTMPDIGYWSMGERLADAWKAGKN